MEINDSRVLFNNGRCEPIDNPPVIIADLIRTPENIGSIIRLAANAGVRRVISIETEPHKEYKIKKTACMAWDCVKLIHCAPEDVMQYVPSDYQFVALETTQQSVNIFTTMLPRRMALVVGNEMHGIRPELLSECPLHVHIPMTGPATSMNVSHATSVALFEWVRQQIFMK